MAYYFRLYTKVFVSKDNTFNETLPITRDNFDPESSSGCFVGVGLPENIDNFSGPISGFTSNDVVDDPDLHIESVVSWNNIGTNSKNAIMFNYSRDNWEIVKHLWYISNFHYNEDDTVDCLFYDENRNITGKIVFECNGNSDDDDPEHSPFHLKRIEQSEYFLGFNSEDTYEPNARSKKNGANWDCALYIIDPTNPKFQEEIDIKTLKLPSIYKPFYMRALIAIDNAKNINTGWHKLRWAANIYNGVGYYDKNSSNIEKYKVGNFSYNLCGLSGETEILRSKPTLLCDYYESINSYGQTLSTGITSVENVNVSFKIKENTPPSEYAYNGFSPNMINLESNADFYTINYSSETVGDVFKMTFNNDSFLGNSSNNVRYFIVTHTFYDRITSKACSNKQKYELNPEILPKTNSTNGFLSLYGANFYGDLEEYGNHSGDNSQSQVILIPDLLFELIKIPGGITTISLKKMSGDWHIIGITDPLIDLLIQDKKLFLKEIENGSVLAPHQNFVSIITYK